MTQLAHNSAAVVTTNHMEISRMDSLVDAAGWPTLLGALRQVSRVEYDDTYNDNNFDELVDQGQ